MIFSFNVAAINLAKAIYYTRAEGYGIVVRDWDAMEPRQKREYVELAEITLEAVKPLPTAHRSPDFFQVAVGITRQHANKVVGRISEDAPRGESA